ncbi:hypothetical protein GJ744_011108 [Endocarpon pusillum]|uniref:Uncharacterized protein n=1 Tax=Endocarpon pusillum TaxID=364733 RepID=A0A8H7AH91_9EURO|nr:hypothetical protein GJ744_011108 [Endocarpon pusillum]
MRVAPCRTRQQLPVYENFDPGFMVINEAAASYQTRRLDGLQGIANASPLLTQTGDSQSCMVP